MMRTLRAYGIDGDLVWDAREIINGNDIYWVSTGQLWNGLLQHVDMPSLIAFHLQGANTNTIESSWGARVNVDELIPRELAELAILKLGSPT